LPRIPGHEVAGLLEDCTAVGVHPNLGCGRCDSCAEGLENRCSDHIDIGIERDGGLAEFVSVPRSHVVPLEGFPIEVAPLVEPLATVLHAARLLGVKEGDAAIVVGAGSLGIVGMWALQPSGARVAVVQRSEVRRRLAADLGADGVLGPEDDPVSVLGARPRLALVAAPGAEALAWALEHVDVGGRVHAFAGTPGGAPVDANLVHYRHLALVGSTGSTVEDFRRGLELARSGRVPLDQMPVARVPRVVRARGRARDVEDACTQDARGGGLRVRHGRTAWQRGSARQLLDEHPAAYKPIEVVMRDQADLVEVAYELHAIANYKGTS